MASLDRARRHTRGHLHCGLFWRWRRVLMTQGSASCLARYRGPGPLSHRMRGHASLERGGWLRAFALKNEVRSPGCGKSWSRTPLLFPPQREMDTTVGLQLSAALLNVRGRRGVQSEWPRGARMVSGAARGDQRAGTPGGRIQPARSAQATEQRGDSSGAPPRASDRRKMTWSSMSFSEARSRSERREAIRFEPLRDLRRQR